MRPTLRKFGVLVGVAMCLGAVPLSGASSPKVAVGVLEFDAPSGLAVAGGHLWVTNEAGNSVTEINPSNGDWLHTFSRSSGYRLSRPVAITRSGADLFVANASSVLEMRASTGALVRLIPDQHGDFNDPVAITSSGNVILVLNAGRPAASVAGSITELNARTGALLRTIKGASFAFDNPAALTVAGPDAYVADKNDNSMTEVDVASGRLVRVVAGEGLDAPDGIAVQDGKIWVSNSAANSATEIDAATGVAVVTETDNDGQYGFGSPLMAIGTSGYVYIASPFGSSPMVTKVNALNGQPSWYMCNTNGPYYFSLLSAFALSGSDLWVASRSGANSQTPGASTGSLTELSTGSGALLMTLPLPPSSTSTTTTTTTTP
jgi:outer membrane protein assembly factor BamB